MLFAAVTFPAGTAVASTGAAALQPAAGQYFPVTPVWALNTGTGTGGVPVAPMTGGSTDTFPVEGVGGVPASGVSDVYVVFNVIGPTAAGCLDDYDPDGGDPNICTTTFDGSNNVTDSDIVQVSGSGEIAVSFNSLGTAGVVVTIMGYYQDDTGTAVGDTYVGLPVDPLVDTRNGTGAPKAQIPAKGSLTVQIGGQGRRATRGARGGGVHRRRQRQRGWVRLGISHRRDRVEPVAA
jgi:hypothetical protein